MNLRQETLVKGSDIAGLEALKTLLKALNNCLPINLSSLKYGFAEEKQEFFCVAEILSNFCASVTLNKMVYKNKLEKFKQEYNIVGSKIKCEHLGMGAPGLWHGTPGGRFRGIVDGADTVMINHLASHSSNSSEDEMGSEHGNSSEEKDGAPVVCEAKVIKFGQ